MAINRFQARCCCAPAHRDMQLEAHRIENTKNSREVRFFGSLQTHDKSLASQAQVATES